MIKARVTKSWPFNVYVAIAVVSAVFVHGSIVAIVSNHDTEQVSSSDTSNLDNDTTNHSSLPQSTPTLVEFIENDQFDSFFARTDALLQLLEDVDVETLQQYWEQAKSIELSNLRTEVQHLVVQRWAVIDPAGALKFISNETEHTQRQDLLDLVFLEWSHANVDEAIRFAHDLDQVGKETAVSSIVRAREDLSIDRRREIARQLGCEWIAIEALGAAIADTVIKDPESEWANFIDEHSDRLDDLSVEQRKMVAYIAYYWTVRDGAEVLGQMRATLPGSFGLFEITEFISQQLKNTHPRLALEVVSKFATQEQDIGFRELGVEVIRSWTEVEPDLALETTYTIEPRSFRRELQKHVLEKTAESDPHAMLDNMDTLPQHLRARAQESALLEIAKDSPESVVPMLSSVPDEKIRKKIEAAVIKHWAIKDIDSLLDRIGTDPKWANDRDAMVSHALEELADTDPSLALEIAATQPVGENGEGMELEVIEGIALSDLDLARALLPNVRAGVTRTNGYSAAIWRSVMADEFDLGIELFLQLCELETNVPPIAIHPLAYGAPKQLFTSLDKVSSASVKEEAASTLLRAHGDDDLFTDEQLDTLRDMIQPLVVLPSRSLIDDAREALDSSTRDSEKD